MDSPRPYHPSPSLPLSHPRHGRTLRHLRYWSEINGLDSPPPLSMKTYLRGPMDYAKTLKLRFRVGDLDLPERRKGYTTSEKEEEAQMCPCGKAVG